MSERLKLHGFNNLTKTLSFNMYDLCFTRTVEDRDAYIKYIDESYNAERLTGILEHVTQIIGANVGLSPEAVVAHLDKSHITVHTYPEKTFELDNYLFGFTEKEIHPGESKEIARKLRREMDEIFYGRNLPGGNQGWWKE